MGESEPRNTPFSEVGAASKLDHVWWGSEATRDEFMAAQLTPLMRALVMTGTVGYAMFLAGMEWLGGNSLPLLPKLLVLALLLLLSLATLPASAIRYVTLVGWACIGLLQVGILLSGLFRTDSVGWLLPGFVVVVLASSATWLNTRDFAIAMLLSLIGPATAWWLLQPNSAVALQATLFVMIALGAASVIHVFIQWQLDAQFRLQKRLARIACTDALTGIANRLHFFALGNQHVEQAHRSGLPLCALFIDVDHFKTINDQYGHAAGDDALVAVAMALKSHMREQDVLGRVGGEEFAMLLPATDLDSAVQVAERQRSGIARLDLSCGGLSVSIGTAMLHRDDQSVNGLLAAADQALQRAKRLGRNRVEAAQAREQHGPPGLHLVADRRVDN